MRKLWELWKEVKDAFETIGLAVAAVSGVIAVIVGLFIIAFTAIKTLSLSYQITFFVALFIGFILFIKALAKTTSYISNRWKPFGKKIANSNEPQRPTFRGDNTVIFFQNRTELPDLLAYVSQFEVVWALWQTATEADNHDIWLSKRIKKLVLIDPSSPYLEIQSKGSGRSVNELQTTIVSVTYRAQKEGVKVKWFVGPIPAAVTIGNPETNPVIRVEPLMVYTNAHNRQSYQLDGRHPQALQAQREQFVSIWKRSIVPYDL